MTKCIKQIAGAAIFFKVKGVKHIITEVLCCYKDAPHEGTCLFHQLKQKSYFFRENEIQKLPFPQKNVLSVEIIAMIIRCKTDEPE